MLQRTRETPAGIDVVKAIGTVSKSDYETVVEPLVEDARREGRRLRVLCEIGPEFRSFTPAAGWEDLKIAPSAMRLCEGCAVVSDARWIRGTTRLTRFVMPCPVHVFSTRERDEALQWLVSLPESPGIAHRLLTDSRVLVVEVQHPLRTQDFDALAATADNWLRTHDALAGVVIHTREFPGWENIGSLIRHARFIRDHRRKVERIALAADGKVAALVPQLANHFVHADVRRFAYDELDDALAWATGPETQRPGEAR
ncbi:STAS/SEC14 domain-containing protein [Streptomyces sp. GS7]|uniref:STAS/SEC14 domain-containing protein n=1 Tax=Streptomyces sp. GS7 TaxID=2692234 RepID=UPI0013162C0F|nr:STAS/SEC14 domain-containing protein [Streptomyces sp. GS7]QHC23022.1 STAS/SEC14 domain-containing protein [Streptomyces sp. GS7]